LIMSDLGGMVLPQCRPARRAVSRLWVPIAERGMSKSVRRGACGRRSACYARNDRGVY